MKITYRTYLFLCLSLLISSIPIQGQDIITLNTKQTSGGTVKGCEGVSLKPGFSFTATSTEKMTLGVDPAVCTPRTEKYFMNQDMNYRVTITPLDEVNTLDFTDRVLTVDRNARVKMTVDYFDGLGRQLQTVQAKVSPKKSDLSDYYEYDAFGRKSAYLIPATGDGAGQFTPLVQLKDHAEEQMGDSYTYYKTIYENSPLNRVLEEYGPGMEWHQNQKPVKTRYLTNDNAVSYLTCGIYRLSSSMLFKDGNYASGELFVTETKDEDGNLAYSFTDKLGRLLLTRQINNGENYDTYYIYDNYGNLTGVLPPMASKLFENSETVSTSTLYSPNLGPLVYEYQYDDRNRCIRTRIPGAGWTNYVYDKADRLIFSQDEEQRKAGKWVFHIYDELGRLIISGLHPIGDDHYDLRKKCENMVVKGTTEVSGSFYGYALSVFPAGITQAQLQANVSLVNYYDNYTYIEGNGKSKYFSSGVGDKESQPSGFTGKEHPSAKGLLVATIDYYSPKESASEFVATVYRYDEKGRLIQSRVSDAFGVHLEYTDYNFTGQPVKKMIKHTVPNPQQTELYTYTYDHAGRLVTKTHQLNNGTPVVLAQNTYDDFGRLKESVANNNANLKTTYKYNVRSWVRDINSPLFAQTIRYTEGGLYNGNIASFTWSGTWGTEGYDFQYDNLSRLIRADYKGSSHVNDRYKNFTTSYRYDMHGNILNLQRHSSYQGGGLIDDLSITYNGNQLKKVTDSASRLDGFVDYVDEEEEYTFDANGSMHTDKNKGAVYRYDLYSGMPSTISINNINTRALNTYRYTASGRKLHVMYYQDKNLLVQPGTGQGIELTAGDFSKYNYTVTDIHYTGNLVYKNYSLEKILIDNGYIENGKYYFYIKDYLGNNRIVADGSGNVIQKTDYYPFGMPLSSSWGEDEQPYKYNDKEYDMRSGLNLNDYHARLQDPILGRFNRVDPLATDFYSVSPYIYCLNNPVKFTDPRGLAPIYDPQGNLLGTDDEGLQGTAIVMEKQNFKQGMSPEDAMKHDLGIMGFIDQGAIDKFIGSYNGLKDRPDWDGYLTLEEANDWYRNGNGEPLFTDLSKIDLSNLYSLGEKYVGEEKVVNFLTASRSLNDGMVYGNIRLKRYPDHHVRAYADKYDFEMHSWKNPLSWGRNLETIIGDKVAGKGIPYEINIYGSKKLTPLFPWTK